MAAGQCSPIRGVFAGAGARWGCCPPPRGCSQEDKLRIRAQLRLGSGNRRTADCWNRTSVDKGSHRRKAPGPIRVVFAGAGASVKFVPPARTCSPEDGIRILAQLRPTAGNRRRAGHWRRTSDEGAFVGGGRHRRAGIVSLCKIFLTSLSHFPLQIIPTGVLLSADNRNQKTL